MYNPLKIKPLLTSRSLRRQEERVTILGYCHSAPQICLASYIMSVSQEESEKGIEGKKVWVLTQLHYRNNDTDHNQAFCQGTYTSEAKAIKAMEELYHKRVEDMSSYGLSFTVSRRDNESGYGHSRKVSEDSPCEADTDEFTVKEMIIA